MAWVACDKTTPIPEVLTAKPLDWQLVLSMMLSKRSEFIFCQILTRSRSAPCLRPSEIRHEAAGNSDVLQGEATAYHIDLELESDCIRQAQGDGFKFGAQDHELIDQRRGKLGTPLVLNDGEGFTDG